MIWWDSLILMQGQRRTVGSFPAIVSMMQGPSSSGTDMNHQSSLNHVQNAVDFCLSDYRGSSGETACLRGTGHNVQSFSGWNTGESSSRLNLINQVNDEGLKSEHGLSSSYNAATEDDLRSEEGQFKANNVIFPVSSNTNLHGNQSRVHPSFLQGSSSTHINQNISLDMGHVANAADRGKGKEAGSSVNANNTSGIDREKTLFGSASCNHTGASSESSGYMAWGDSANSSSSLVNWGPSCKRKALEGSSRQLCSGGSSSTLVQSGNGCWPTDPVDLNASSDLTDSTPIEDIPVTSPPLFQNATNEERQEAPNGFPLISIAENVERPLRNFDRRMSHLQHQESVPLNLPSTGSARHHNHSSLHQAPGSHSINDSLELRLTAGGTSSANSGASLNQSPALRIHSFPWNRTANPRGARSSTSYNSGERAVREDFNLRMFPRDSTEHPMNVPASSGHEPIGWHTPSGNVNNSGGAPPPSWIGSSSNVHSPANRSWIFNHEVPAENMQSVSEFSPWSLFPSISSASGVHNAHSAPSSSGPTSFTQGSSSNQSYARTALVMERRGGDVLSGGPHSLRALTFDNEGRRRLISEIRQVLMAMRRGENLRAEDYMVFDHPFLYHGMAEMHDRHREMRLDVDNMSYEELLALEEHIGDVSTGLNEDVIIKLMKQRIYVRAIIMTDSYTDLEPCCICQEEFSDGENVGSLDCGHEFHSGCIKQWLMQKNLCPICKTTALAT
ncbi:hypothetical protein AAZX31_02G098000 [Glycine max]|uniref:RING-type E3 ubiquitin transferase n=1 Tax=Glycine soja TaxID=3848 RepID=A0A445LM99_GLYSO|nr:E3 ubiquitin-protein ligase MBR2-like isoform X2 [Glycine soja]XP_028201960.1 E3 ubiquitin-protein ligase MBR2-like isoform X2 [Glycine soja]RZC24314.1 E3 ubiquitin-protein ligase MBR2 isoform A [Glycine soja]RZC24315.1 E3 ubiquitin-protein ligase MBR2 isoform B [Glycine soja]